MKNERLSFARQFKPLSQDVLDFGGLSPLQSGSLWSVIAFIQPTTSQQYAGIISKRTDFKVGKNQFTFWLKNASISVEADTQGVTSGLVPPLNRWAYVGAASSSHQTTIYLGVDGEVSFEHRKGIVTGTAEGQLPLTIGKLGGNFPGAIAFVCLYAEALPDAVMRDLCAGTLAPADVKGLAFGWTARGLGEVDVVSASAPNVIGTKLIRLDDLRPKSSTAEPPKQVIASDAKQAVESLDDRKNSKPKRGLRITSMSLLGWLRGNRADPYRSLAGLSDDAWFEAIKESLEQSSYQGIPLPGFPKDDLQRQFAGSAGEATLREGFRFYQVVRDYAERFGRPLARSAKVLDFGCGWGRMVRFFLKDLGPEGIVGADVDPVVVDLCRSLFPHGTFSVVPAVPPSSLPEGSFDVIYAYSVFSHLNEEIHLQWVREFSRLLKPRGLLLATTQGRTFVDFCAELRSKPKQESLWHEALERSFMDRDAALAAYDRGEVLHSPTGGGDFRPSSFYGETLIPKQFVEKRWAPHLELVEFKDDRNFLPQALIVARRPA